MHRIAFDNLHLRLGVRPAGAGRLRFLDWILVMKSESVDASIETVRTRGNRHCADREFVFADLALIA